MASKIFNKKAMSQGSAIAVGALVVLGGGYLYTNNTSSINSILPVQSVSSNSADVGKTLPSVYISSLVASNSTLFTITNSGTGANTDYIIEVDKDLLGNTHRTETFTVGITQNVAGTSSLNTIENYQKIFVPFKSDYTLKDTSNIGHSILSFASSTFAGSQGFKTLTMSGATEVVKTFSLDLNPNNADLTTLTSINDVGEYVNVPFDFGQINKVTLKLKN